ncbi:four helix bundle protein [Clostridium beijerinckii]|nr:four helix bundle protein [Clostridium beijerinckii]
MRSGTSIGANVKEGIRGFSKSDFRFKMNIALKEANETEYWIELLIKSSIIEQIAGNSILLKCRELCKILNSIVKNSI